MSEVLSILSNCFRQLSMIETISKTDCQNGFIESWTIRTEIPYNNFQKEADLIISFLPTFPITIPKLFLSQEFYDKTKYIPHVNFDKSICLFDKNFMFLDNQRPFDIIIECIRKAKSILQLGLENKNISDFFDEIKAYWTHKYDNKDTVLSGYISLLPENNEISKVIKLLEITPDYNRSTKYFLTESTEHQTIKYLEEKGYNFKESNALFLENFDLKERPPYNYTNISFLENLDPSEKKNIIKYVNGNIFNNHVFFSKSNRILGFKIPTLKTDRKGFRQGSLTHSKVMETFQKNDNLSRISVDKYNSERIEERTSGLQHEKFKFLIIGLGSIGSNLTYFLNAINYPSFTFVDNEVLSIDNVGRHFLGFEDIRHYKTISLKSHFKDIRPDQNIRTIEAPIESILNKDFTLFNDNDFAFVCIGNQNIENYIIDFINSKKITTPTFFLWVEPFLIGGHCLFIHPNKPINKDELFDRYNYKYNIISNESYEEKKDIFLKKESGCQTSYLPYSANHIILFLSQIYYHIDNQIKNKYEKSFVIRWTGDLNLANNLEIEVDSSIAKQYQIQLIQF